MVLIVEKFFCLSLRTATLTIGSLATVFGLLNVLILTLGLVDFDDREVAMEIFGHSLVMLSGLLLILGTIKKSLMLFLPVLVLTFPILILGMGMAILFVLNMANGMQMFLSIVGVLFLFGFGVYMWIAIFSFGCELYEEFLRKCNLGPESEINMTDKELHPKSEVNITTKELYPKLLNIHI